MALGLFLKEKLDERVLNSLNINLQKNYLTDLIILLKGKNFKKRRDRNSRKIYRA